MPSPRMDTRTAWHPLGESHLGVLLADGTFSLFDAADDALTEQGFIVPGLGDVGDRQFGTAAAAGAGAGAAAVVPGSSPRRIAGTISIGG